MMPPEVCDGHEPPRSTSHGREIDLTSAADAPNGAFLTVWTLHENHIHKTRNAVHERVPRARDAGWWLGGLEGARTGGTPRMVRF